MMGEYVWTSIVIGGKLSRKVADKLAAFEEEFEDSGDVADAIEQKQAVCFQGEVNFGNPDKLLTFCRAHKLAYNSSWAAKCGAFGSGMEYWFPDMKEPVQVDADDDSRPVITIRELQVELEVGTTLAEVVARFELADHKKIPPLELKPPKRKKAVNEGCKKAGEESEKPKYPAWDWREAETADESNEPEGISTAPKKRRAK
jgi:hypothetical protein